MQCEALEQHWLEVDFRRGFKHQAQHSGMVPQVNVQTASKRTRDGSFQEVIKAAAQGRGQVSAPSASHQQPQGSLAEALAALAPPPSSRSATRSHRPPSGAMVMAVFSSRGAPGGCLAASRLAGGGRRGERAGHATHAWMTRTQFI